MQAMIVVADYSVK